MDKYEYKLRLDELKTLVGEQKYEQAAELCDELNWKKVKNVNSLIQAGEAYEKVGRFEDAREALMAAYERSPIGRMIIYRLAELAIRVKNFDEAREYYDEFVDIAPHDNLRYVLRYEMMKAEGVPLAERIALLEEFKEEEYTEKWAFELAYLYHRAGDSAKCVDACDELVLWFGDGPYVEKALELKMLYQPLNKIQEQKYRDFRIKKTGQVEVHTGERLHSGEIIAETIRIPDVSLNTEKYNTVNLQAEIAKSMEQIANAKETNEVSDSMDIIKNIVEEIPYLQIEEEKKPEEEEEEAHIETDEEIDSNLHAEFERYLAEEQDGQMSLMMPEERVSMPQITGQLSIDEVLAEWEKTRRAAEAAIQDNEERRLESEKRRALKEAREIMDKLSQVIPQLEAGMTPKEILEDKYKTDAKVALSEQEEEKATRLVEDVNDILQKEIDRLNRDLHVAAERRPERREPDPGIRELKSPEEDMVDAPLPIMMEPPVEQEVPEIPEPVEALKEQEEPEAAEIKEEPKEPETAEIKEEPKEPDISDMMEKPEEHDVSGLIEKPKEPEIRLSVEKAEDEVQEKTNAEVEKEDVKIAEKEKPASDLVSTESPEKWIPKDVSSVQPPESVKKDVKPFEPVKVQKEAAGIRTADLPQIVMPETLFDTRELPTKHLNELAEKNATIEAVKKAAEQEEQKPHFTEPIEETAQEPQKAPVTEPVVAAVPEPQKAAAPEPKKAASPEPQKAVAPKPAAPEKREESPARKKDPDFKPSPAPKRKVRELDESERQLFSYFLKVEGMENQIKNTVAHISDQYQEGGRFCGHILIQGVSGNGKTTLATDIVKAVKGRTGRKFSHVAGIEAAALNRKDMGKLFEKLQGGALLVGDAGYLSTNTASRLAAAMKEDKSGILVVLEGTKEGLSGIMGQCPALASHFLERIVIPAFTSDELVQFAKAYANEEEYEIDELAVLALYDRISKIRKLDEVTTLAEVKEIVDRAIDKAEKISVRNLFGGRRSDENGYVLLQEKDFS